ncbi:MAG: hypothetical protein A2X46_11910 [Lentisphaerae bacterium GWF2_57_35]|nr:MAG: hypothetical protein A2X46_11910 [Lentisphaerae bacterium GWF2_57_35]
MRGSFTRSAGLFEIGVLNYIYTGSIGVKTLDAILPSGSIKGKEIATRYRVCDDNVVSTNSFGYPCNGNLSHALIRIAPLIYPIVVGDKLELVRSNK